MESDTDIKTDGLIEDSSVEESPKPEVQVPDIAIIEQFVDRKTGIRVLKITSVCDPDSVAYRGIAGVTREGKPARFEFNYPDGMSLCDCFINAEAVGKMAYMGMQKEQAQKQEIILPPGAKV